MSKGLTRILLIIGFVVVVLGVGAALYFLFFYTPPEEEVVGANISIEEFIAQVLPDVDLGATRIIPEEEKPQVIEVEIPEVAAGGETLAVSVYRGESKNVSLSSTGELRFYDPASGVFYTIDGEGNQQALTDEVFRGVENVTWSGADDQAVLEFPDGSNVVYDFETGKQYTLPAEMENFGFSEEGDKIAYKFNSDDPDSRWLGIANPDGTGVKGINFLGENGATVDVNWSPTNRVVATFTKAKGVNQTKVSFLGLNNENFKGMIVEGRGFEGMWSPDGQYMLYSVYNPNTNYNPTLWIVQADGEDIGKNRTQINLQTWTDKCTFNTSGTTVYCGVPINLPKGAGLTPSLADEVDHDLYKINLRNGVITKLAEPVSGNKETFVVDRLFVTNDESELYFRDGIDGQIYRIAL